LSSQTRGEQRLTGSEDQKGRAKEAGMMMTPKITMTETPEGHMKQAIVAPLARFNEAQSGRPEDYRRLVILVSHPDNSEILGGLWGEPMYSHLHVELLFVPESLRYRALVGN
jgi:hypothetical protein